MRCGTVSSRPGCVAAALVVALALTACNRQEKEPPAPVRYVRTVTVEPLRQAPDLTFAGHVEAQDQASLAFRIGGRLAERLVGVGASVVAGQVVARLDPENELNDLRAAQAGLTAAQGDLRKAENQHQRQSHLLERHITTQADYEAAQQGLTAARAQVDAAQARVASAEDIVGFTTLKADAPGVVTRVGAEPAEVVAAGRMIVQLARREGRDAVFEIPADLVRRVTPGLQVRVTLAGEAGTEVAGRVREIAPQADPVTRTFQVRVGLAEPPPAFRLGAAVSGSVRPAGGGLIAVPATALTRRDQSAGAWIVDPQSLTVALRKLDVANSDPATAWIAKGLNVGDIVVTAGAGLLQEGQKVRLMGAEPR
ncbi:efflux RND transporter periplasmic adaptor subunit [Bosea sp. (in: a-proteobacteria)]|uniref:efflux RND transporter periplasmic adaptor subunit n=1 Tax=Bosea sp. (in: a-proteobacteria) TaxID=1871050 RepID=UPI0026096D9A|nr:efflux RND transporter periplasmic adaptor subunit [Bosea sp. (in: a-proteobacteria)]MCO5091046.1 efflux RND transporter periplasmic adaptor subunit [Bosea sp. (in: a-proteobacteria)]